MKRRLLGIASVAAAAGVGIFGGVAVAGTLTLQTPAGVSAAPGVATVPKPAPSYARNKAGLTFGSALAANSPETEPDLIQAIATNGVEGYVRKADLDLADGADAAKSFKSPADAIKWQQKQGAADRSIKVYAADGQTVIGTFVIAGASTQAGLAQAAAESNQRQRPQEGS